MARREIARSSDTAPSSLALGYGYELATENYQDITVDLATRTRSMYMIGLPNSGKTSMIETLLYQDIHNGVGNALLDVEDTISIRHLRHMRDAGIEPIVIDPTHKTHTMPLNVLAVPDGVAPYTVVENLLAATKRVWLDSWGPRLEDGFKYGLRLLQEHGLTIAEFPRLLSNTAFRHRLADQSRDEAVRDYYIEYLDGISPKQWRDWIEPIRNKVARLVDNPFIGPSLAAESCVDFRAIMDAGGKLVIRVPEDVLKDSASLYAMLLVSKLYDAALSRPEGSRPFIIFADEFSAFASRVWVDLTMRSRKRGIGGVVAHQAASQRPFDTNPEFLSSIVSTAAVQVVMQVARPDAVRMAPEIFPAFGTLPKKSKKHWLWGEHIEKGTPNYSIQEEREAHARQLEHQKSREFFAKIRGEETKVYAGQAYERPEPISTHDQGLELARAQISRLGVSLKVVREQQQARIAPYQPRRRRIARRDDDGDPA